MNGGLHDDRAFGDARLPAARAGRWLGRSKPARAEVGGQQAAEHRDRDDRTISVSDRGCRSSFEEVQVLQGRFISGVEIGNQLALENGPSGP